MPGTRTGDLGFVDRRHMVLHGNPGELTVTARLWYQHMGFRWAENLRAYDAPEPTRFVTYWDAMASESALMLWTDTVTVRQ